MRFPPDSKLPGVGTTIFTVMAEIAADCDATNLAQGFPSFEPPRSLTDRVCFHLANGANQYAPMPGVPALRQAIAGKIARDQGRQLDADEEITVCTGATEGLFSVIQAMVRRGDEVILLDPAYDSYEPAVTLCGGRARHVPMAIDDAGEFRVDWGRVRAAVNDKTRLIVVNFPHNPTGAILDADDLAQLAAIVADCSAYVLSDEVYEHIVFDGACHRSVLSHDDLWPRCFVVSSFGKTLHATGWKIGYCVAPPLLSAEFRKVHQFTTFAVSTPMQHAIADFLSAEPDFATSLASFYQQKRDLFCRQFADSAFRLTPARSTFFQVLDYGEISRSPDVDTAKRWTRDYGVASIPLSVFSEQDFTGPRLRFCFAKDDELLCKAAARLKTISE